MKTVLHFVRTNIFSGLESTVINICTLVSGYRHYYVCPTGPIDAYLKQNQINRIVLNKLTPRTVLQVLRQYQPDIVQGHDVVASVCLAANKGYCRRHGIKIISQLHSNDTRMQKLTWRSGIYALSSFAYDKVIGVSDAIRQEYLFKKLIRSKFVVINNVINPQILQQQLQQLELSTQWDCIFIGRMEQAKNPLMFVQIIAALKVKYPHIKAVMLGSGQLTSVVQQAIAQADLDKNIDFLGFQKNQYPYLQASRLLLITSQYEGFGLAALEALLLGKPVLATPVGGLTQLIDDRCGSVASDVATFVRQADQLLASQSSYNQKSIAAMQKAHQVNQISQFVQAFQQVYAD
ncbi:glycosyltransferase [Bombilactobacillus folatiphilus]|uniref:Glycosyltransferase n=1 Tax=Bombilactobacillus folatiphilus TaxID=2923362 RepID=A0ABY4P802_9LACO|nr:glycosyltransferase [Bombilactobacillus folatiphilus]UQS81715.1 glycosyltransferase [Bombilactobacillus folatiphilus]